MELSAKKPRKSGLFPTLDGGQLGNHIKIPLSNPSHSSVGFEIGFKLLR